MPEATAIIRKFSLLKLGISLTEQEKMTEKETKIWYTVAENYERYLNKKKLEIENFGRMR